MRVRLIATVATAAAFAVAAALAVPAQAANGPSTGAGCTTSDTCYVELKSMIHLTGDVSGSPSDVVPITPPPCLWVPQGDAHTGSQVILNFYNNTDPGASAPFDGQAAYQQAQQLVKSDPITPGEWYQLPINPAAGPGGAAECLKLPLWYFAPPATPLPGINVPPQTLAQYAIDNLQTLSLGKIILNPRRTSDTNLPTFIDVTLVTPNGNPEAVNVYNGHPYVAVTAYIPGVDSATVWAVASSLQITPGVLPAHVATNCGVQGGGRHYTLGSTESAAQMAAAGPNSQSVDCGVTYTSPGSSVLVVSINWTTCWQDANSAAAPAATPPPPPDGCQGLPPAPGGANLAGSTATQPVNVREIQSVNGG